MNKIMLITEPVTGEHFISARELHEKLGIETRFNDWFSRICEYGFIEDTDFYSKMSKSFTGGRPQTDYEISIEMAKQICMLQRSEKGREYREYFIKLEKAWNTPEAIFARALQMADKTIANVNEQIRLLSIENQKQKEEIAELTPDAESWRKFAESDGTFSATNVAKCLGIKRDELLNWLEVKHYIMRSRSDNPNKKGKYQGTAQGIEYGYIKNYVYTNDNISCIQFHLTPKGMQKVQKAFSEYKSGVDYVKKAMENTPETKVESLFRPNNILGLKAE